MIYNQASGIGLSLFTLCGSNMELDPKERHL